MAPLTAFQRKPRSNERKFWASPVTKPDGLAREVGIGVGVTVGGAAVTVGGTEVTVGGAAVTVGGAAVTVGGAAVTVGGADVTVGGALSGVEVASVLDWPSFHVRAPRLTIAPAGLLSTAAGIAGSGLLVRTAADPAASLKL